MLGLILCRLGLHQPVVTVPGVRSDYHRIATSAHGYCARCNKEYQWDH